MGCGVSMMLTFRCTSFRRLLSRAWSVGAFDNLPFDGDVPAVITHPYLYVFFAHSGKVSVENVLVALFRDVDRWAGHRILQRFKMVEVAEAIERMHRASERLLQHSEERTHFAEELATERHIAWGIWLRIEKWELVRMFSFYTGRSEGEHSGYIDSGLPFFEESWACNRSFRVEPRAFWTMNEIENTVEVAR